MQWKNIKFWLWLEIEFPESVVGLKQEEDDWFLPHPDGEAINLTAEDDDMGSQGPQCFTPRGIPICFDLLSFQSEFELNSIPTAVVNVALGRRADDVTKAAGIHAYIDKLQLQLPATVWCFARTLSGSSDVAGEWPETKFRVFVGNVTGSGFKLSTSGAEFTLSLTHWLSNLNFSSALSKQSHPLNPSQYFFKTNFTHELSLSGGGAFLPVNGAGLVGLQLGKRFFDAETVTTDFWGGSDRIADSGLEIKDGLKNWLLFLTNQDRINGSQLDVLVGARDPKPIINKEACRALLRFEPDAITDSFEDIGYRLGVPLGLPPDADLNAHIAHSIGAEIGLEGLEAYTNVTLWDKLAGQFHSNYLYSIVPLVEKALVVPFIPGLSGGNTEDLVHRAIYASQYDSMEFHTFMPRPLRAVGLILGKKYEAGGPPTKARGASLGSFGGYFDKWANSATANGGAPADGDLQYKEGLIMFKEGPRWLTSVASDFLYSGKSTGVLSTDVSVSTAPTAGEPASVAQPRDIFISAGPVWDRYARALYMLEVLKMRQGTITGPVRFDIAPGSQIRVQVAEDKFVKSIVNDVPLDQLCDVDAATWCWCSVLRVSTYIDCQNARAFTSYYVAHLRNASENLDSSTSIDMHPLWQSHQWIGCVLVDNDAFAPLATKSET